MEVLKIIGYVVGGLIVLVIAGVILVVSQITDEEDIDDYDY